MDESLDFSGISGPCDLPESLRLTLAEAGQSPAIHPEEAAAELCRRAAEAYGLSPEQVLASSDAGEFIYAIPRALRPRRAVILAPCPHDYWRACDGVGVEAEGLPASEAREFVPDLEEMTARLGGAEMLFLGNPNDPTGAALPADALRGLAARFPGLMLVVDERFGELVPEAAGVSMLGHPLPDNVIVVRSLPYIGEPAGPAPGFMVASAGLCDKVKGTLQPHACGMAAARAGVALLDASRELAAWREPMIAERERVREALSALPGLRIFRSQAGFLLLKSTKPGLTSATLCERLLSRKLLACNVAGLRGLDGRFLRICIRRPEENDLLLDAMRDALENAKWK